MSISPERAQELQEQYQELKETILDIDKKYVDEHLQKLTGDRNLKKYVL